MLFCSRLKRNYRYISNHVIHLKLKQSLSHLYFNKKLSGESAMISFFFFFICIISNLCLFSYFVCLARGLSMLLIIIKELTYGFIYFFHYFFFVFSFISSTSFSFIYFEACLLDICNLGSFCLLSN